jgi:hypothetical protein
LTCIATHSSEAVADALLLHSVGGRPPGAAGVAAILAGWLIC